MWTIRLLTVSRLDSSSNVSAKLSGNTSGQVVQKHVWKILPGEVQEKCSGKVPAHVPGKLIRRIRESVQKSVWKNQKVFRAPDPENVSRKLVRQLSGKQFGTIFPDNLEFIPFISFVYVSEY